MVSFGGQATDPNRRFTNFGETKGEAKGILKRRSPAKISTQGALADVSEQQREMNYKTHKHTTTYYKKVQVWKVTCEENAHKCKYAKWVCALNLFIEN